MKSWTWNDDNNYFDGKDLWLGTRDPDTNEATLILLDVERLEVTSRIPLGQESTICEAGVRSCTAASLLASAGFTDVAHVPGGSSGYRASGLPLAFPAAEVAGR